MDLGLEDTEEHFRRFLDEFVANVSLILSSLMTFPNIFSVDMAVERKG